MNTKLYGIVVERDIGVPLHPSFTVNVYREGEDWPLTSMRVPYPRRDRADIDEQLPAIGTRFRINLVAS
jgi:hypothetical protein